MEKRFKVTNWDFKEVEFVITVDSSSDGSAHSVKCFSVNDPVNHKRDVVCSSIDLERAITDMELEARMLYQKVNHLVLLDEMGFTGSKQLPSSEFTRSQIRTDHALFMLRDELPDVVYEKVQDVLRQAGV